MGNRRRLVKSWYAAVKAWPRMVFSYPPEIRLGMDYEEYWHARRGAAMGVLSDFQRNRGDIVAGWVSEGDVILDIGCGDGALLEYIRGQKRIDATGVDVSPSALESMASKGFPAIGRRITEPADFDALPECDHIFMFEVLEHMPEAEKVLLRAVRHARKSVVFSVPNSGYFPHRLRMVLGRFPLQWVLHPGEHVRFWTLRDMRWWLDALGLKVNTVRPYEGLPVLNHIIPSVLAMGLLVRVPADLRCGNIGL